MNRWGCLVVVFMMGTLPGHHGAAPVKGGRPAAAAKAAAPGPAVGQAQKTAGSGVGKLVAGPGGRTASRSKGSSSVSGTGARTGR